jgi:ribonuclease R
LARELHIPHPDYTAFRALVRDLLADRTLMLGRGRTIVQPVQTGTVVGTLRLRPRGLASLECPGRPALLIRPGGNGAALDGDTVAVRVIPPRRRNQRPAAEVIRVISRAQVRWTGTLERDGRRWVIHPHGKTPSPVVQIEDPTAKSARPGDMVVVEPVEAGSRTTAPRGVIVERLGPPDLARTKILGVIRRHGLPEAFSADTRRAAQRAAFSFDAAEIADRLDLRDTLTVTIDPPDARDFDDALSLRQLADRHLELGVHIADVSHFVRPGTALDREACQRGNSTYFPGYVVPMLPEALSNGVCSLQPGQARYAKSVFITYDHAATRVAVRFADSVIQSARRLTYDEVTSVLSGKSADVEPPVVRLLEDAEDLARRIRHRRLADGMITLALPEVEIQLGPDGQVVDARPADSSFSHTIIEMFMVEANEVVSQQLTRAGIPHLRRIHPPPDDIAPALARQLTGILGRRPPRILDRGTVLRALATVRGRPEEPATNLLLLQSMAQAVYSPSSEGHFALASPDYCHFTSPIRRYPDLVNHRLLSTYMQATSTRSGRSRHAPVPGPDLSELGQYASTTERRSQQAEREAKALLLLALMKSKIGQSFDGVVCGVAPFGAFVQIRPHLAEGLMHVSELGRDDWNYDERSGTLVGRRSGCVVAIGQSLRVRVAAVDEARQQLRLTLDGPLPPGRPRGRQPASRPHAGRRSKPRRSVR